MTSVLLPFTFGGRAEVECLAGAVVKPAAAPDRAVLMTGPGTSLAYWVDGVRGVCGGEFVVAELTYWLRGLVARVPLDLLSEQWSSLRPVTLPANGFLELPLQRRELPREGAAPRRRMLRLCLVAVELEPGSNVRP